MATSEQVHGQEYVDFDEYIDIQLRKTSSTIKATDVLTAAVGILTLITLYLLLFVICDHWIVPGGFGPVSRAIMLAVVGSAACGWLVLKIVVPWRRRVSGLYAASTIEKASPALKSSLINLVDITRSGQEVNPEIYHSIERRAALALSHVDVNETVDRHTLLRLSNALLAVVVLFCLYWIFSPKNPASSLWRAIVPTANMGVATRTEIFNVRPGDKDVLARSQLEVTADIRGEIPSQTNLFFTTADGKFVDEKVEMRLENEATRKFRCVLTGDNGGGILQNLTYCIEAGDAKTPKYHIRVIQPPAATIESIRLESPAYTRREPATQTTGAIDALEGTHVTLKARTNMPVRSPASLQFFDDESATKRMDEKPIRVTDGTKLEVDWNLEIRDGVYPHFYRIFCTNLDGESEPNPNLYSLTIHPDQSPEILLRDPKTDLELPANAKLPLVIEARDPDFALSYIDLYIEKDGSPVNGPNIYSGHDQQFKATHIWSLRDYHFRPKETVTYWLEAKDNRQPVANVSKTPKLHIRIIDPVPEKQVQKDLQMAEQRQKEETDKSEAANSAQEQPDSDNSPQSGNQKRPQAGQSQPQKQLASRDEEQKSSQGGEGEERSQDQNGDSQNGNQQDGQKNAAGKGKENDKDQNSASERDKKQKLNPDDPADDAPALNRIMDQQRREEQNQKTSSGAGQGKEGADQPKNSDKKSPSSPNQTGDEGSSSKDSQNKKTGEKKSDQGNSSQSNSSSSNSPGTEQPEKKPAGSISQNDQTEGTKREGSHQSPDQKNTDQKNSEQKNSGQKNPDQKNQKDQAAGAGDNKEQASGSKPGEKPSESNPGEKKQEAGRDAKSAQQKGSDKADSNGPKQSASEGPPQSKDEQQKAGDRQQDQTQGPHQPGASNQDQNQGSKPGQPEPGQNKPSSSNDSSAPGTPSKPTADAKENKSGTASENRKEKPGTTDQPNKSPGSSQNGDEPSKDTGKKPDKDGTPQGGSQNNTGDRTNSQNSQHSDDARAKQDANVKKEPGSSDNGRQASGPDDRNQKNSAQQDQQDSGSRKANKDQRESGSQKPSASREQQDQPGKRATKDGTPDEKAQKKRDGSEDATGDNSEQQKQKEDRRAKRSADEEPPTDNPQADQGPDKKTRNKKPQPVGGGDSSPGDSADSKQSGNQQDASGKSGSQKQSAQDQQGGQSQEQPGGRKQPGTKKPGGNQEQGNGSPDQTKKSESSKPGAQGQEQKQSENQKPGSQGQQQGQQGKGQKGQQGQGQQGGQQGQGQKGQASGQSGKGSGSKQTGTGSKGSKPGSGSGNSSSGMGGGGGVNNGTGSGQGEPLVDTSKDANLDYAKRATNLVLNKLEDQLKRGQIDKKLQEELGWNKDQIRRFVERMKQQSKAADDSASPASEARRLQFEETLKSLNLHSPAKARSSQAVPKTNDSEIGINRSIPPPEYRDLYKAFTKSLAKQATSSAQEKK